MRDQRIWKRVAPACALTVALLIAACGGGPSIETISLPSESNPLVALRLTFATGSVDDPADKKGLAALTGLMIGNASTQKRSFAELVDALYPLAGSIQVSTDREVTQIFGQVHRDAAQEYVDLLLEALLEPGFREDDFERNRAQLRSHIESNLRASDDEGLGLAVIQEQIYEGHPYAHPPAGSVRGLETVTLDDVKAFYAEHFTQDRLRVGIAGGFDAALESSLLDALAALPATGAERVEITAPKAPEGRRFTFVEKQTASTGIHIAWPLEINRSDADFYPLLVVNSFLGEHRTFHGRLMNELRVERGLNYGDYSYIEYFWNPGGTMQPVPGFPRQQQYFSVWIRPVVPQTAHFALRTALHEVQRVIDAGLTQEEFETTREYMLNFSRLWGETLGGRLGIASDSAFYGMPPYLDEIEKRLSALTLDEVNGALRRHLSLDNYEAVFITANAQQLADAIQAENQSPMSYPNPPTADVLAADETIAALEVGMTDYDIVPVAEVFEN